MLIGLGVLFLMLWEPHIEGRNARATTFEIYFNDPFLAYVYVGSIAFFVALHRAFRVFGDVRRTGAFSTATVRDLRTIKKCAWAIVGFVIGAAIFIIRLGDGEDRPAGIVMSAVVALGSGLVATAATLLAKKLDRALRAAAGGQT